MHSDQVRQYESQLFQSVCKFLEIDKTRTTPGHPRSDGLVERANRTIKDMLAKYVRFDQKDWDHFIDFVAMAYNATPQESTGISPYRMTYGEEMRMPLDVLTGGQDVSEDDSEIINEHHYVMKLRENLEEIHSIARDSLGQAAKRQKQQYDKSVKRMEYNDGDLVRRYQPRIQKGVKKKLSRLWTGPWVIVEKLTDVLYKIKHSQNSPSVIVHADNLKLYKGEILPRWYKPHKTVLEAEIPDLRSIEDTQRVDSDSGTDTTTELAVADKNNVNLDGSSEMLNQLPSSPGTPLVETEKNSTVSTKSVPTDRYTPPDKTVEKYTDTPSSAPPGSPPVGKVEKYTNTPSSAPPGTPPAIYKTRLGRIIRKPLRYQ